MAFEQKDNTGSLFKNSKKENEKQPDYTGTALVDGIPKRLAAWIKTSKKGTKYISISIKSDEERPKPINSAEDDGYKPAELSAYDDIPF
jgi:uncharacterized protein (DUF736 family)